MLFRFINSFGQDPLGATLVLVVTLGALVSALTIHEFGHALASHRLGDETARAMGRLSLNPLRHIDPLGAIMLLVVGFGWGKPVQVNAALLQRGRLGMAAVSIAGPGSNFVFAALLAAVVRLTSFDLRDLSLSDPLSWVGFLLLIAIFYNLLLGVFNLIPLAPLDGSKVLIGIAPRELAYNLMRFESYGVIILVMIIAADAVLNFGILSRVLVPPVTWLSALLLGQSMI